MRKRRGFQRQQLEMMDFALTPGNYRAYTGAGIAALLAWYNRATGLWESTGWWNSANALEAVIDCSLRTKTTTYQDIISTTFEKNKRGNFLNDYYDDEGWWALAWIKAYDLTGDKRYLSMAEIIFADMQRGWDMTCGGGIWWSKKRDYKNAIANELFLTVAARLYRRASNKSYLHWAEQEWTWFNKSGMINAQNLVNDGLNSVCQNNGQTTWTYNQGVILGGLVDMHKITGDHSYISKAEAIADAAISTLVDANGILMEPCESSGGCGADGPQFKGIFMRNLSYLYETDSKKAYKEFILRNADSIWLKNRNNANQFGLRWAGPHDSADACRQSAAIDALNAAIPFSS
jgi:predicted alpha-1,6-mannanase (GH76 family)